MQLYWDETIGRCKRVAFHFFIGCKYFAKIIESKGLKTKNLFGKSEFTLSRLFFLDKV